MTGSGKSISLVLGSGGARGLAHIGIIKWLEENDYKIKSISGASIGALIGGIYAAGKLNEYEKWVRAIRKIDMVSLLDLAFSRSGFVKGEKIISTLRDLVGDLQIEDLPITFTALASDLNRQKEVWINQGSLFDAIRASISMPLFFTPHNHKGKMLVDGGVLNPVPIAPTFDDQTDMTIAVNLGGDPVRQPQLLLEDKEEDTDAPLHEKILQFIANLANGDEGDDGSWDLFDIANQSFDAMQSTIARQKLAAYPPDILIEIPRNVCGVLEFDRASELIKLGHHRAEKVIGSAVTCNGAL